VTDTALPNAGASQSPIIGYVNVGHFLDHYAMLIFPAAVILMEKDFGASYGDLLALAAPGFIAFGAGSMLAGWMADTWSRRHMMTVYFVGMGLSLMACGWATSQFALGTALFFVGVFASIYHPVGTTLIATYASSLARGIGFNGMIGNLGVASSAVVTGLIADAYGWRTAFILPGALTVGAGLIFALRMREDLQGKPAPRTSERPSTTHIVRLLVALGLTILASSAIFNAITVAMPKLLQERLSEATVAPAVWGLVAAGLYMIGALSQYTIGTIADRRGLFTLLIPIALTVTAAPFLVAYAYGPMLVAACLPLIAAWSRLRMRSLARTPRRSGARRSMDCAIS
jgi:MFS family permease